MMSSLLLQIFAFMLCTFILGLLLGWLIWRYGGVSHRALVSANTEVDFWRNNLEQCRNELGLEQSKCVALNKQTAELKKRLAAQKAKADLSGDGH